MTRKALPLGKKAYSKIPHLPGSRTGSADRTAPGSLAERCTQHARPDDTIVVQEKLDGSCVAVAQLGGEVVALGREGWRAHESSNPGRQLFARWVDANAERFRRVLKEGEWVVGEWLALAHSTRYRLTHEPFVVFDLFDGAGLAVSTRVLDARLGDGFVRPQVLHSGAALSIAEAEVLLGVHGHHGAIDPVEGAMWRVESEAHVLARAKFVRGGKVDGVFLPENSGKAAVWNWGADQVFPSPQPSPPSEERGNWSRHVSRPLLFVTPNSWNSEETQRLLAGLRVEYSRIALPRGDSPVLEDVARFRANAAWAKLKRPCFVENTELAIDGETPLTGALFKQLHRELGDDGFCARFGGRRGETRVIVALVRAKGDVQLFTGRGEGQVPSSPRGQGGYGWDRVWQPDGYAQTIAELGDSRFLINMRQRPFLELAAMVRGDGTPGYFEAHVTVKPCDLDAFAASCGKLRVKCLHIVMPSGTAQAEQPMTGSYHLGTFSHAREEVLELARSLVREGFEVTRMKIEATGRAFGAPETDLAARDLPMDTYFEHHATVLLPEGFDERTLISRCRALNGYVSRNTRKTAPERFLTMRSYKVGRGTADARFERVIDELRALGLTLKNRAREYTVFDSAPQIDAGWFEAPGEST